MKKISLFVFVASVALFFAGCKDKYWKSRELTPENTFTKNVEGPAIIGSGSLFVVNYKKEGTIGIVDSLGRADLFIDLPKGSIGNGIRFDKNWNMYIADYVNHNILVMRSGERSINVYAHDSSMNQPNDLAITSTGILFASDPNWKNSTGQIYRVSRKGEFVKIDSGMGTTNGIEVSPGDKYLYVNESVQKKIWRYDLDTAGNISNKKLFIEFPDFSLDGMRCDVDGNLYVCRYFKGTIDIVSPEGKVIREVKLKGKNVSNIAFGGYDGKTCYVTIQDKGNIETFRSETAGREWTFFQ
jgi:sugar lactone lactonase YvrE